MKLCFLAAANSIHSYRWIKYFAERGYEITWVSLAPMSYEPIQNVNYVEILTTKNPLKILTTIFKLKSLLNKEKPTVLHVHSVGTYGLVGLLTGFVPLVATPWGSDVIFGKHNPFKRFFIKRCLHKAKFITCDAYHMKEEIAALGVNTDKVHIINFGIDTKRFSAKGRSKDIRHQFGIGDAPAVISLRNFEPVYDIPTLLKAIPIVHQTNPDVHFVIVGRGTLENELKSMAKELGLREDKVHFLGYIPNQELPNYISSMDIYVSTSLSDAGIAASTAEAMACELPVVVTDSGENAKWIQQGVNGFIVPVRESEVLAKHICILLNDKSTATKLGFAGRNTILERNDFSHEMGKMDALYKSHT